MFKANDVVLPANLCSTEGIKIDKETRIDGITVTTQQLVAHYGTYDEYGHLAYAVVQMGAPDAAVATSEPIAFLIPELRHQIGVFDWVGLGALIEFNGLGGSRVCFRQGSVVARLSV